MAKNELMISKIKKYLQEQPKNKEMWTMLSYYYGFNKKMLDDSIYAVQEALALDPNYVPALILLGHYNAKTFHLKEAMEVFQRILTMELTNSEASEVWNGIGLTLFITTDVKSKYSNGDLSFLYSEAIKAYKNALLYNPTWLPPLINLARLYEITDRLKKSFKLHSKALEVNPNKFQSLLGIGRIYLRWHNYQKSLEYIRKALKVKPNSSEALFFLSVISIQKNDYNKAIQLQKRIVKKKPNFPTKILDKVSRERFWIV